MARSPTPRESRAGASVPTVKHGNAGVRSIAAGLDAPPNVQCGVRFSLEHPRPVPCGLAVPTPRPMTMSTTRATPCCSCSPTPSLRLLYLRTSVRWTSSWWPCLVDSPWTFSPLRSKNGLNQNPIIWLTILGGTASHFVSGSLQGCPRHERSSSPRKTTCCALECVRWDLRR